MNHPEPLVAVVLAAGESRRFKNDKRMAQLASGKTILQSSVDSLASVIESIYVVIRPSDAQSDHQPFNTQPGVQKLQAPGAAGGMGCSLADAVRQLPSGCHVMIALGDMPYIRAETVEKLLQLFRASEKPAPIAFPVFGDSQRGHPVLFHRHYRTELATLAGDKGAGRIIAAHPDAHEPLEVSDRGVLFDVDVPEDLEQS